MYKVIKKNVTFGYAFDFIKEYPEDYGIRLPEWSEEVVIRVQTPTDNSKMTAPYLYVQSRYGNVPWKETMIELFSEEWIIVKVREEAKVTTAKCDGDCVNCFLCTDNIKIGPFFGSIINSTKKTPIEKVNKINKVNDKVDSITESLRYLNKESCSPDYKKKCLHECDSKEINDNKIKDKIKSENNKATEKTSTFNDKNTEEEVIKDIKKMSVQFGEGMKAIAKGCDEYKKKLDTGINVGEEMKTLSKDCDEYKKELDRGIKDFYNFLSDLSDYIK